MVAELVKMSAKGQLVVPQDIREQEGFTPGDRFIPVGVKEGVLFKKMEMPDIDEEFRKLSGEITKQFLKKRVHPHDVQEAVKWARK